MSLDSICIYCGSSAGRDEKYTGQARELACALACQGITIIYGGARVGLMGEIADAALEAGGRVVGVIPHALVDKEVAHHGLTELHVVSSMHERKALMAELSDGFVALPGGIGTFEELFEIWTWAQLGLHAKPCSLFNAAGYYDPLIAFLDQAVGEGFLKPAVRGMLITATAPDDLIARLRAYKAVGVQKWISGDET
jgi:uncharacterized protein (TIGR00730 family)